MSWAAYVVLDVTTERYKKILNITVEANETSKFWLRINIEEIYEYDHYNTFLISYTMRRVCIGRNKI